MTLPRKVLATTNDTGVSSGNNANWPEGRPSPEHRELAALLCFPEGINVRVTCRCGEWEFRDTNISEGLSATERYCPRCRKRVLIVCRGADLVGIVDFTANGSRTDSLARALLAAGLTPSEVERLVGIAQSRAAS